MAQNTTDDGRGRGVRGSVTPALASKRPLDNRPTKSYYFAYGSNLHLAQMRRRCPDAEPICRAVVRGWRLAFRLHADVEPAGSDEQVVGAVYRVTERDVAALDRYEGYPTYYDREYVRVTLPDGKERRLMFYSMRRGGWEGGPETAYLSTIMDGYRAWGLMDDHGEDLQRVVERARAADGRRMKGANQRFAFANEDQMTIFDYPEPTPIVGAPGTTFDGQNIDEVWEDLKRIRE